MNRTPNQLNVAQLAHLATHGDTSERRAVLDLMATLAEHVTLESIGPELWCATETYGNGIAYFAPWFSWDGALIDYATERALYEVQS